MPAHEFKVDPLEELLIWFKQLLDPRSPQATFDNSRVFTTVPTTPGGPRIIVPSVNLPDPSKTPSSVPQPYQAESWGWVKDLYQSKTPSSVPQPYQAEPWGWIQDPYGGGL